MKDVEENYKGFNGIRIFPTKTRTKIVASTESHQFVDLVCVQNINPPLGGAIRVI